MADAQVCMACGMDPIKGRRTQLNPPDPRYALCPSCADPASWVGEVIHPPNSCRICGPRGSRARESDHAEEIREAVDLVRFARSLGLEDSLAKEAHDG